MVLLFVHRIICYTNSPTQTFVCYLSSITFKFSDCWEYCYGKEDKVVDRLTYIVNEVGFDGIDIDYEYFYEDNQNGSGFTKGTQAQTFLRDITVGLRNKLPIGSELTHAPMERKFLVSIISLRIMYICRRYEFYPNLYFSLFFSILLILQRIWNQAEATLTC